MLLDSVILIDHLNQRAEATEYLRRVRQNAGISVVTRGEVLVGVPFERWSEPLLLLDLFETFPVSVQVADLAAQIRQRHRLKLSDAVQAATAQHHGLRLATRNTRDFPLDRFPFVVVPYSIP